MDASETLGRPGLYAVPACSGFGQHGVIPIITDPRKRRKVLSLLEQACKKSLAADITAEIGHAQQFARRIKTLSGIVPGSQAFAPSQSMLQPPAETTDDDRDSDRR
jgi:hypothetical protein